MIDKKQAKALGVTTIDRTQVLQEAQAEKIKVIKKLLPNTIADNQLNIEALQEILSKHSTTSNNKGYELSFAGKGLAKAQADTATMKELKIEKAQSKNFDTTGNVVIRGDNLDVLKILYKNYYKKIKMIYIDPPYNTQSKDKEFIYKNDFRTSEQELIEELGLEEDTINFLNNVYGTRSHSGWLSFMYPRLKIARELLRDDGFIAIAIDHYELNNLICIADEIFGEENRLGIISVVHKPEGRQFSNFVSASNEFMLFYANNINICNFVTTVVDNEIAKTFDKEDNLGKYRLNNYLRTGGGDVSLRVNKPEFFYPIFVSPDMRDISLTKKEGYTKILPITNAKQERTWKTMKETFYQNFLDGNIVVQKDEKDIIQIYEKYREKQVLKTYWHQPKYHAIHHGTNVVSKLLGGNYFDYPKSIYVVLDTLKLTTNNNDLILDFFAGSGTTGDAVMQLNAEDGGKRKYILVQLDEKIDEKKNKEAYNFCKENKFQPLISSICIERLNRAGEKLKQEENNADKNIDIGYKVFSLVEKPNIDMQEDKLQLVHERQGTANTLYNMLVATCKPLDSPIETIIKDTLYICDNEVYLLATVDRDTLIKYKDHKVNIDAYASIDLQAYFNMQVSTSENINIVY